MFVECTKFYKKIVFVGHAKFWVFLDKLRTVKVQNYMNCMNHSAHWMCKLFRKIVDMHERLSVLQEIAYFEHTLLSKLFE